LTGLSFRLLLFSGHGVRGNIPHASDPRLGDFAKENATAMTGLHHTNDIRDLTPPIPRACLKARRIDGVFLLVKGLRLEA